MWSGRGDRNWAKEHHNLWYRRLTGDAQGDGKAAGQRR